MYVGCTNRTVDERAGKDGIQYAGQPIYTAIKEFGWKNVVTEILDVRDCDEDTATAIEEGYIKEYQSNNPDFGYNSPTSSRYHNGSRPLSEESCKKIGLSKVGRIWCHKDDDLRFVTPDEWIILEQEGYVKGFTEKTRNRKRNSLLSLISVRNSEGDLKRVRSSQLDGYLKSGWILEEEYQNKKKAKHLAEVEERRKNRVPVPKRFIYMNTRYRFVDAEVAEDLVARGLAIYDAPKHTEEARRKISVASRNRYKDPAEREKSRQIALNNLNKILERWNSPEVVIKRNKAIKKSHQTSEYKAKASASLRGRIWVCNGIKSKTIKPEELEYHLNNGWYRGRKINKE